MNKDGNNEISDNIDKGNRSSEKRTAIRDSTDVSDVTKLLHN